MAVEAQPAEALPFEAAMRRLEAIVERLELGELELEEALKVFEEGVRLSRRCAEQLEAAERRVEILVGEGRLETRPFEEPEEPNR
jgi:exodeoxyribonuclease VII small subunit